MAAIAGIIRGLAAIAVGHILVSAKVIFAFHALPAVSPLPTLLLTCGLYSRAQLSRNCGTPLRSNAAQN